MDPKILEIANLPAAELIEQLGALSAAELSALRAAEATAGDKARTDVLAAIDAAIANLPAAELIEQLGTLSAAELSALRAAETTAGDKARTDVLAAIDAALAAAKPTSGAEGVGAGTGGDTPPATVSVADETPEWQKPDYSGPLDIEKMDWRNRNIKPVVNADTKATAKAANATKAGKAK